MSDLAAEMGAPRSGEVTGAWVRSCWTATVVIVAMAATTIMAVASVTTGQRRR